MIEGIGRRLATVLERRDEVRSGGDARADATGHAAPPGDAGPTVDAGPPGVAGPTVAFLAYGDDCLLMGRIRLPTERLSDLLNQRDAIEILDVSAERLIDGYVVSAPALIVERGELLLVQIAGPRGDPERRRRTRAFPVAAQLGPYRVRGLVHARPSQDPIASIRHGPPMVPLTEAWIERPVGGERDIQSIGAVVLNRDRLDWVVETWDDSSRWLAIDLVGPVGAATPASSSGALAYQPTDPPIDPSIDPSEP